MKLYNYDPNSGAYIGETTADESPLEPGVYLVPAAATTTPPPTAGSGEYARFTDDGWQVEAIQEAPAPEAPPEPIPWEPIPYEPLPPWDNLRNERDKLLRASDITQLRDIQLANNAEWVTYRQLLRDLPDTLTDPEDVVWPVKPDFILVGNN